MSCCGDKAKSKPATTKEDIEKILANLPVAVHGYYDTGAHQLHQLSLLLPPDGKSRTYGRPTFHRDGSIEYPKQEGPPPKDINGYYRDEGNPFLFHPLWGECLLRMQGARMDPKTGEIDVKMVCNSPQASTFQKFVTADQCSECPFRKTKNPA